MEAGASLIAFPAGPGSRVNRRAVRARRDFEGTILCHEPPWGLLPSTLEPVVENMGDRLIHAVISSSKWREVADHVLRHLTN